MRSGEDRPPARSYDASSYWEQRYERLDLTRSGHRDLPELYNGWLYRRKAQVLRNTLRSLGFSVRGKRALELGAGTGAYVTFWKELGIGDLTGVELTAAGTAALRRNHPEFTFVQRDVSSANLAAECGTGYDLATALDVFYHVTEDAGLDAALTNVAGMLKQNGLLVIHDQFLHRPTEHHGYIRWRSLLDWQSALDRAGFDVVRRTPIFYLMIQANDCRSKIGADIMAWLWVRLNALIRRFPSGAGRALYATDTVLSLLLREGPSMELLVARRR